MNDIEAKLRAALRPVAPREEFTDALIAAVTQTAQLPTTAARFSRRSKHAGWLAAGLAASLLIAVGLQHHLQQLRDYQTGLQARRQVIEALRVTSQKLNLAYEVIKKQSASLTEENPGA